EPGTAGVLEQRVLARRVDQPVCDGLVGDQPVEAVTAVFELASDVFGEVGCLVGTGEVAGGGDCFGTEDQCHVGVAAGDGGCHFGDQVLWCLSTDDVE